MQAANDAALSLVTPVGFQSGDCGYCKAEESSQRTHNSRASYYAITKSLRPEHYQELMNRGWRRSGNLLYLPDASRSCCPHYTIRLPASDFQASKDQRQTLNRWNRFILGEKHIKQASIAKPKTKEYDIQFVSICETDQDEREKKRANNTFDLCAAVHESEQADVNTNVDPAPEHTFTATLEPDTLTDEKYALFFDYQQHVHHEAPNEISKNGFKRFLCSSPLQRRTEISGKKLGSYHHCYRVDGRLIAMSVLDLLPHAVSGVYFIYHRNFEKWSLGKLSALREAALALEGGYQFYYMGYYIHGCAKMQYKGTYKPQYVLDLDGFGWSILDDETRWLMEKRKWVSMSRERRREHVKSKSSPEASEDGLKSSDGDGAGPGEAETDFNDAKDIYPSPLHPIPLEAANSGLSLLEIGMPGVLTLDQLKEQVNLDKVRISLGRGGVHRVEDLVLWHDGSETDSRSIKGIVAEMAACLGPDLMGEKGMVLDFSR